MNFEEYINVVKNVNSDIFILLLMFLLEKKPFSSYSIQVYSLNAEKPKVNVSNTPKLEPQRIASPSLQSRFISPKLRKKNLDKNRKKGLTEAANLLQMYSGVDTSKNKNKEEKKNLEKKSDKKEKEKEKQRPQRRVRIKLDNLVDKTPELSKNTFTFGKNVKNDSNEQNNNANNKEEDDDIIDIQEDQCVQYEGYVYKYSQSQKKMKQTYFKLIGKDLYYYKKKEEQNPRGMHNLSGVFIKKGDDFEYDGKNWCCKNYN